jgi:type I restriction enzyme S subunit
VPAIDVAAKDLETLRSILQRHLPGREIWVFGSRALRAAKRFSDLDLAILGDSGIPAAALADLREALDESDLPFKVDLVDWSTTSPSFRRIIESQHVPLGEARPTT